MNGAYVIKEFLKTQKVGPITANPAFKSELIASGSLQGTKRVGIGQV